MSICERRHHAVLRVFFFIFFQRKESQVQISRSLSVPVNNKERQLRRMDSFFRVIPSTPRVKEVDVISISSPTVDSGTFLVCSCTMVKVINTLHFT